MPIHVYNFYFYSFVKSKPLKEKITQHATWHFAKNDTEISV
jgi:hypothetical protein